MLAGQCYARGGGGDGPRKGTELDPEKGGFGPGQYKGERAFFERPVDKSRHERWTRWRK